MLFVGLVPMDAHLKSPGGAKPQVLRLLELWRRGGAAPEARWGGAGTGPGASSSPWWDALRACSERERDTVGR